MWILAFQDRLYWLIKGQTYTIGRSSKTKNSNVDFEVSGDASVSRKHATIEVRSASPDSASHPSIRSDLVITDLNSRFGTKVDGNVLDAGSSFAIQQSSNGMASIKLGSGTKLRLLWHSFVITYSTGLSGAPHNTLWQHALNILEPLDVKLMPYIVKSTDLYVKTGKSTSSLYYALAKQIPIANNQYFEALQEAAVELSKSGTLDSTIIPSFDPFLPEPRWSPKKERMSCLAGCTFHVPSPDYAKGIEPILEAAGGICVPIESAKRLNAIFVYSASATSAKQRGVRFVLDTSIFNALEDCRSLRESDIQIIETEGSPKPSPPAKRAKLDILNVMTQGSQPKAAVPTNSGRAVSHQKPVVRNQPKRSILDTMISEKPAAKPDPSESVEANPPAKRLRSSSAAAENQKAKDTPKSQKRDARTQLQISSPKRRNVGRRADDPDPDYFAEPETKGLGEDLALENHDAIEKLAIVDCSLVIPKRNSDAKRAVSFGVNERPNFKAFRRRGEPASRPKPRRLAMPFSENERKEDASTLSAKKRDISTNIAPPRQHNRAIESEEQLFVSHDAGEEDAESTRDESAHEVESQNGSRAEQRGAPPDDDEFGFAFS